MLEGRQTLDPERSLLWHYPHSAGASNQRTASAANEAFSAIRQGPWKLIFFYGNRRYELYNLEKDLSESRNVLTDNQAIATRLSRQLRDELTKTGAKLPLDAATKREIELPPPISK
jgi:hypothetical protein